MINRVGFTIEKMEIRECVGSESILLFASKNNNVKIKNDIFKPEKCEDFCKKWKEVCAELEKKILRLKSPFFGLGASHPQSRFLIFSGIGKYVSALIDDDPYKTGKYVYIPNPIKIISTEQYLSNPRGSVLHIAFGYDSWAEKISKRGIPVIKFKERLVDEIT
jgi:hypothetical protein